MTNHLTHSKPDPKQKVHKYWNTQACGTEHAKSDKFTKQYFDEIEEKRYQLEPEIFSFAQFPRYHGKKVLEVGTGAGTDFLQWARSGCDLHGIDLTEESTELIKKRLELENLTAQIQKADAENIPHPDNTFDLVYSWGVIHHSPNTEKALKEIIRVCKPGGTCKIMVYNRHSLFALYSWINNALLKGKAWKSLKWCMHHHVESKGTKAYTVKELKKMLNPHKVKNLKITPALTHYDIYSSHKKFFQSLAKLLATLTGGQKRGWFITIKFQKEA